MPTYQQLPSEDRYIGNFENGEIEITCKPSDELLVVYSDKYITLVKDPVKFPSGNVGSYLRIFANTELNGNHGVVIVPVFDNKLILLRMFRHPTRSWELEFPRGFAEAGQSAAQNARRETEEELGVTEFDLECMGVICPNTGFLATRAEAYVANLRQPPNVETPDGTEEAIESAVFVSNVEFQALVAKNKIRCGFTLSAFTIALAKGLI
jgi:ADP-ribose pyrophosphatase